MKKYTLGLDLHKRTSTWVLTDHDGEVRYESTVLVHPDHISRTIRTLPVSPSEIHAGLEPVCGWRWVRTLLLEAGMHVSIANPLKLALIGKSTKKTDRADARILADLLRSGFFPESYCVDEETRILRSLVRARAHLVRLRTSLKNRLHGTTTENGKHLIPGGNPLRKAGRAHLKEHGDIAERTVLVAEGDLSMRIAELDRHIAANITHGNDRSLIESIPGMGVLTAATIVAEAGDIRRFITARHFAAYAGLVPRERSSGGVQRFGAISKTGPTLLRFALVESAMRIREKNAPELYAHIARMAPSTGAKKARVALARRLATIIYAMVKNNTPYDSSSIPIPSPRGTANVSDLVVSVAH